MDQHLIIKFWRASLSDEAFLTTLERDLTPVLGDAAKFDGYDVSAQEINLFVLTSDPKQSFRRIKRVLEASGKMQGVSAASRLVGGAQFTSIWPLRPMRRFKLP